MSGFQVLRESELGESVACVEIDNGLGGCPQRELAAVYELGSRLHAMIAPLTT